jgi:hypothetical protein
MHVRMNLGGFPGMVCGMKPVSVSDMRVMRRLFVVPFLVMVGGLAMVGRCMLVVFSRFLVVFRGLFVVHRRILFLDKMCGRAKAGSALH